MGTPVALVAEPAPPPGSLVRGQRKGAVSFFTELREQLQCAPVVTPTGAPEGPQVPPAAASPSREQVEVVEFHSRNKRKQKPGEGENTKVMSNLYVQGKDPDIVVLGEYLYNSCQNIHSMTF